MMMPFWADAVLLQSPRARRPEWHIRAGWNAYEGYRTRCNKNIPADALEWPIVRSNITFGLENQEVICPKCKRAWEKLQHAG